MMKNETNKEPTYCPNCGSNSIAEIRYGLYRPTPESDKEIKEGRWIPGGCLSHPALPKWLCKACNTRIFEPYKKEEIDTL